MKNATDLAALCESLPEGTVIDSGERVRPVAEVVEELKRVRATNSELTDRISRQGLELNSLRARLDQALARAAAPHQVRMAAIQAEADRRNSGR
jgi:predicted nuclease with TOPRIM domain